MSPTPRREFLKLAFAGALAAAGAALDAAAASAEPLGPADALRPRQRARRGARAGEESVQGARGLDPRPLRRPQFRPIHLDSARSRHGRLGRRQIRLRARAAASRLHLHDADGIERRRERPVAAPDLRPQPLRFRQARRAQGSARPRLFRRAPAARRRRPKAGRTRRSSRAPPSSRASRAARPTA